MIRRFVLPVLLAMAVLLTACAKEEEPAPTAAAAPSGPALLAHLEWDGTDAPTACRVYLDTVGSEVYVSDGEQVGNLWQAAGEITLGEMHQSPVEGQYHYVEFLFPGGGALALPLNDKSLDQGESLYHLENGDPFFALMQQLGSAAE